MGTWGCKPLENDCASDLKLTWDDLIAPRIHSIKEEEIISTFMKDWGDPIDYIDTSTNLEIIALCYLMNRSGLGFSEKTKRIFENAISYELKRDVLGEWENKKERKEELLSLLSIFNGKKRSVKTSEDQFINRLNLNLTEYEEYLITVFNGAPIKEFSLYFIHLNNLFNFSNCGHSDDPDEEKRVRCMMLLCYVSTENGWKKKDIEEYLNIIRKSNPVSILGRFPDLSKFTETSALNKENNTYVNKPRFYKSCAEAKEYLLKLVDCYEVGPVSFIQKHFPRFLDLYCTIKDIGYRGEDYWRSTEIEKKNQLLALLYVAIVCGWSDICFKKALKLTLERLRS